MFSVERVGSDYFAAGADGKVFRRTAADSPWREISDGPTVSLRGTWGSAPDDMWAVGDEGVILHHDGYEVSAFLSAATHSTFPGAGPSALFDVWGTGTENAWAVGAEGLILRWNGRSWATFRRGFPGEGNLLAVFTATPNDVWFGGERNSLLRVIDGYFTSCRDPRPAPRGVGAGHSRDRGRRHLGRRRGGVIGDGSVPHAGQPLRRQRVVFGSGARCAGLRSELAAVGGVRPMTSGCGWGGCRSTSANRARAKESSTGTSIGQVWSQQLVQFPSRPTSGCSETTGIRSSCRCPTRRSLSGDPTCGRSGIEGYGCGGEDREPASPPVFPPTRARLRSPGTRSCDRLSSATVLRGGTDAAAGLGAGGSRGCAVGGCRRGLRRRRAGRPQAGCR